MSNAHIKKFDDFYHRNECQKLFAHQKPAAAAAAAQKANVDINVELFRNVLAH